MQDEAKAMFMVVAMRMLMLQRVEEEEACMEEGLYHNVIIVENGVIKALNVISQRGWEVICILCLL